MDNNNDVALVVAIVTALAAIIAPLITSLIHSVTEFRLKKLELSYQERVKVFREFTLSYKNLTYEKNYFAASKFQAIANQTAILCGNRYLRNDLIKLGNMVIGTLCRSENSDALYEHCIKILFTEL